MFEGSAMFEGSGAFEGSALFEGSAAFDGSGAEEDGSGMDGEGEEEEEEEGPVFFFLEESTGYMQPTMSFLAVFHTVIAVLCIIGYNCLKVPYTEDESPCLSVCPSVCLLITVLTQCLRLRFPW